MASGAEDAHDLAAVMDTLTPDCFLEQVALRAALADRGLSFRTDDEGPR